MKYFVCICLLVLALNNLCNAQSRDVQYGQPGQQDRLLYTEVIKEEPGIGPVKREFNFPGSYWTGQPFDKIGAVMVRDHYTDGNGGRTTFLYGGPETKTVGLRFTSKWMRGMHFTVEIWGH